MGLIGALIARDQDHRQVWDLVGISHPATSPLIDGEDLYADAFACLRSAKQAGLLVGIAGNQLACAEAQLRDNGFNVDFIASSAAWGLEKLSPEFFSRVIAETQLNARQVLYVGDRLDNDVLPARRAGMRTALFVGAHGGTSMPNVKRSVWLTCRSNLLLSSRKFSSALERYFVDENARVFRVAAGLPFVSGAARKL